MGHSIAVLAFFVNPGEVPSPLSSWHDVEGLISERWNRYEHNRDAEGFLMSSSRNWWHQHLLYLICQAHDIKGLEFTGREVTCLGHDELQAAEKGLDELFRLTSTHRLQEKLANAEAYSDILESNYRSAFDRAQRAVLVETYDAGFDAAVSFFAFLKSLRYVVQRAYEENESLLYVMPDFQDIGRGF